MFKELLPLLQERTIVLTIAKTGDALCVNFIPKANTDAKEKENPALSAPLTVEGTADELDAQLPTLLANYTAGRAGFKSNLDAMTKQFTEALATVEADNKKKLDEKKGKKTIGVTKTDPVVEEPAEPKSDLFAAGLPPAAAPGPVVDAAAPKRVPAHRPVRGKTVEAASPPVIEDPAAGPPPPIPVPAPIPAPGPEPEEVDPFASDEDAAPAITAAGVEEEDECPF